MVHNEHKHLKGKRIRLVRCDDPWTDLRPGARGTVKAIDDIGTIFVAWDNGSCLGLCPTAGDKFEEI